MKTLYSSLALALAVAFSASQAHAQIPVANIAAARALGSGVAVSIPDVVVSSDVDTVNSTSVASIHIQDATGGLNITGFESGEIDILMAQGATTGNQIDITGTLSSFNGILQLTGFSASPALNVDNLDGFVGVPAPAVVTTADLQDGSGTAESFESELVLLQNVTFTSGGSFGGSANFTVTDGSLNATVRVGTTSNSLVGTAIPAGPVNITGIFSQFDSSNPFDSGYQIQLLGVDSITAVPEPATAMLAVFGIMGCMVRRRS